MTCALVSRQREKVVALTGGDTVRCVGAKHRQFLPVALFHAAHPSLCNHSFPSLHLSSLFLISPSPSLRGMSTSPLGHSCIILDRLFHLHRSCCWSGLLSCLWITEQRRARFSGNLAEERSAGQERAHFDFGVTPDLWADTHIILHSYRMSWIQ